VVAVEKGKVILEGLAGALLLVPGMAAADAWWQMEDRRKNAFPAVVGQYCMVRVDGKADISKHGK
jgi:hypothetical protein